MVCHESLPIVGSNVTAPSFANLPLPTIAEVPAHRYRAGRERRGGRVSDGRVLLLWSGPRNVSTALMYAFAQRPDTSVVALPFPILCPPRL